MQNYFDLYQVLVNELAGDIWIFLILGLIIVAYISMRNRLPEEVMYIMLIIFSAIVFAKTNLIIIWIFIALAVFGFFYYKVTQAIKR